MFGLCAHCVAVAVGSPWAFTLALVSVIAWALTGPVFHYSDTWQLVINTATTIVTFLMVFLIQNTQNRDTRAIQLKLDELLRAVRGARTSFVDLENLTDEELNSLQKQFERIRGREQTARNNSAKNSNSHEQPE
jgi:low affinity Fe/Cu permease